MPTSNLANVERDKRACGGMSNYIDQAQISTYVHPLSTTLVNYSNEVKLEAWKKLEASNIHVIPFEKCKSKRQRSELCDRLWLNTTQQTRYRHRYRGYPSSRVGCDGSNNINGNRKGNDSKKRQAQEYDWWLCLNYFDFYSVLSWAELPLCSSFTSSALVVFVQRPQIPRIEDTRHHWFYKLHWHWRLTLTHD